MVAEDRKRTPGGHHRPRYGNRIKLEGATVDEVADKHRLPGPMPPDPVTTFVVQGHQEPHQLVGATVHVTDDVVARLLHPSIQSAGRPIRPPTMEHRRSEKPTVSIQVRNREQDVSELHSNTGQGLGAIRSLDYGVLLCEDLPAMQRFYADVMGFAVRTEVPGRWVEFEVGSTSLALRLRSRPYDGQPPPAESASVQFAFRLPLRELDAAVDQLAEHGVELLEPIADLEPFGHRAFFFADPEYNIIEIYGEL